MFASLAAASASIEKSSSTTVIWLLSFAAGTVLELMFYVQHTQEECAMVTKTERHEVTAEADPQGKRGGETALRQNRMMAHLMAALEQGHDIGHYGRLVFAMVARHFLSEDEVVGWLAKDRDCSEADARALYLQVQGRDYNPPKRDKILEWQKQQDFPIIPDAEDPDEGNVYKDLQFPEGVYEHIQEYYEQKAEQADQHEPAA